MSLLWFNFILGLNALNSLSSINKLKNKYIVYKEEDA